MPDETAIDRPGVISLYSFTVSGLTKAPTFGLLYVFQSGPSLILRPGMW